MTIKQSTGLCQTLLASTGDTFKNTFDLGFIKIYKGAVPDSADLAPTGTLIVTVSNNSTATGITFEEPIGGEIAKETTETWSGVVVGAGGLATYYRLVTATDLGTENATDERIQGTIGTGGTDMVLGNATLVLGATFPINYFTMSLVPS